MNYASTLHRLLRGLFWLTVAWGAAIVWLAPHPPLQDLPQHAGQLALLRHLLEGGSPWAAMFQITPLSPYLVGFGLTLPLSYLMPVAAAFQLVLSLAYVAFVGVCVLLRRHFGGDARLDWLFLCSYFGFAYQWGFFTFLIAAPLALGLILLTDRHAARGSGRSGLAVMLVGVLLIFTHSLVFAFAMLMSLALWALRSRHDPLTGLKRAWPLADVGLVLLAYAMARAPTEAALALPATVPGVMWQLGVRHEVLAYAFGMKWVPAYAAAALAFAAAPFLLGLRIHGRRQPAALLIFGLLLVGLNVVPSFVFESAMVYQRFALFLFPAYAWIFAAPQPAAKAPARWRHAAALLMLVLACWSLLALNSKRTLDFARESADFDRVVSRLEPGERALALIHDTASPATGNAGAYVNHASWYQAERGGLVEFSYAWLPQQVVRYRLEARPPVGVGFSWRPKQFDWQQHQADRYRYFFVRGGDSEAASLFKGAPCAPRLVAQDGQWRVFERLADCTQSAAAASR